MRREGAPTGLAPSRTVTHFAAAAALAFAMCGPAHASDGSAPHLVQKDGRYALMVDGEPFVMLAGQVHNWFGLILTLFADLALLGLILLARRYGGSRRLSPMRIAAIEPITRGPLEPLVEQVEGDLYLVRGEVLHADDDEVILDAGEREVIVILDGHDNPVGYQQSAQVRGRVVG